MTMVIIVPVQLSRAQNRSCSSGAPTRWNPTCALVPLLVTTVHDAHADPGFRNVRRATERGDEVLFGDIDNPRERTGKRAQHVS
jgi:hypothetical protein